MRQVDWLHSAPTLVKQTEACNEEKGDSKNSWKVIPCLGHWLAACGNTCSSVYGYAARQPGLRKGLTLAILLQGVIAPCTDPISCSRASRAAAEAVLLDCSCRGKVGHTWDAGGASAAGAHEAGTGLPATMVAPAAARPSLTALQGKACS